MHPFESFLYYSALFIPLCFSFSPFLVLVTKIDLILGAVLGHDGFGGTALGHGSRFHYVHHERVECNYGDAMVPLDWLFGSYRPG